MSTLLHSAARAELVPLAQQQELKHLPSFLLELREFHVNFPSHRRRIWVLGRCCSGSPASLNSSWLLQQEILEAFTTCPLEQQFKTNAYRESLLSTSCSEFNIQNNFTTSPEAPQQLLFTVIVKGHMVVKHPKLCLSLSLFKLYWGALIPFN